MRPDRVVMSSPDFDQNLGLLQRVENLSIQKFISQTGVEAFNVAVLPRTAWRDISRLGTNGSMHPAWAAGL